MNHRFLYTYILFGIINIQAIYAQILDDSTKQVYGPNTTKFVVEEDFLNNNYEIIKTDSTYTKMAAKYRIDTILDGFHNYGYLFQNYEPYQDLGNFLSPSQPIYYIQPNEIGRKLGFNAFDRYTINPFKIKYYDTRSPYSQIQYVQGSKGQQALSVDLSRNIIDRWNIGIQFKRMTSKKILGSNTANGNSLTKILQSNDYAFAAYTRYYSKNEKYHLLANFTHSHQSFYDNGGIKYTTANPNPDSLFIYEFAETNLNNSRIPNDPRTIDRRVQYHLFHEYSIDSKALLQLYHTVDLEKRAVRFDNLLVNGPANTKNGDTLFYSKLLEKLDSKYLYSDAVIADRTDFKLFENVLGLKGKLAKLNYRFYYRYRNLNYTQSNNNSRQILIVNPFLVNTETNVPIIDSRFSENYLGGFLGLVLNKGYNFFAEGESSYEAYRLKFLINNKYLNAGLLSSSYMPSLVQTAYRGDIYQWQNSFKNTKSNKLFGNITYKNKYLFIQPGASIETINDFIYYDTLARPMQAGEAIVFTNAEILFKWNVGSFFGENYFRATRQNSEKYYRSLPYFLMNRVYWQSNIFKKAAVIQLGFDSFWKPAYLANAYMPVTQQFYLNDTKQTNYYFLVDVFLNVQIKRASVFLKGSHINQAIRRNSGYYITPDYSGMPFSFDFGIKWQFFD